ncbi:MAG: DUF5615 family PIN-like protein [Hyphomonadaceae bacterium]
MDDLLKRITSEPDKFGGRPCIRGLRKAAASVFITKDRDFAELVTRLGPPPSIILLSCGNTSNVYVRAVLRNELAAALTLARSGEPLVEIGG